MSSLTCIQLDNGQLHPLGGQQQRYNVLVDRVCSQNGTWCAGVLANLEDGQYGAYSGCNYTERLSFASNQLYIGHGNGSEACANTGGVLQQADLSPPRNCQFMLRQAKVDGTGMVTQTALPDKLVETVRKGGLSTGGKAGVAVAVIVIILTVVGLFIHRRKQKLASRADSAEVDVSELPDTGIAKSRGVEIAGEERREIAGNEVLEGETKIISEMPTEHNEPVELDGSGIGKH
jgi:hypothetical protein